MSRVIQRAGCMGLVAAATASVAAQQEQDVGRGYAAEAMADARSRVSLVAAPAGGPTFSGYAQFRYYVNFRDDGPGDNDMTNGFQTARTVLRATGQIDERIGYFVQGRFRHSDSGDFFLDDAYGTYKADDHWTFLWGQFRMPALREEFTAEVHQLAAERSVMNSVFNQGRSQGVATKYQGDDFRFQAGFSDGVRTANSDFDSAAEADFALCARLDWRGAGEWDRFKDFTSWRGSDLAWTVGAACHWQSGGETVGTTDTDVFVVTVDGSIEGDGWNAFAAGVWRGVDPATGSDWDDFGWLVQGGYFLTEDCEAFARWDQVFPDSDRTAGKTFSALTVGLNHYVIPESHAARLTVGFSYYPTAQADSASIVSPSTLTGLLGSADDGQWNLMAQFQIVY